VIDAKTKKNESEKSLKAIQENDILIFQKDIFSENGTRNLLKLLREEWK
jgi:hypothetical protein